MAELDCRQKAYLAGKDAMLRELRAALKGYVSKLGKHDRGCLEELRLLRALVASVNDTGFGLQFETLSGGQTYPDPGTVEQLMALFVLANDDEAFKYKDPGTLKIYLSSIEGPIGQAA